MKKHIKQNKELENPHIFKKQQLPNEVFQSPAPSNNSSACQHLAPPALSLAMTTISKY